MADRALCRSAGPVVSRGVLRQRSDNPNYHNGRYNSDYHNIEHHDYKHNYTCHKHHRNNDVYYYNYGYNHHRYRTDHAYREKR
jgi:hypothetical protein